MLCYSAPAMKKLGSALGLTATDLANHLACRHLTQLDLAVAQGARRPPDWFSPDAAAMRERGLDHEAAFLKHLEESGLRVTRLGDEPDEAAAFERTRNAMRSGDDVIAQATLLEGPWVGRADVLRRVERASDLGAWSYEAWDTKLSRETKCGSVLQVCMYSDLLESIQGVRPVLMHVVPPRAGFQPDTYRVDDFAAYYRRVKGRLVAAAGAAPGPATYPLPVPHCDVCRWWPDCDRRRRGDDHLSLVAGISRLQTRELEGRGIETLQALASEPLPLSWRPSRGAVEGYTRVREQARLQRDGRRTGKALHEFLPHKETFGLERLPEPSAGDVFFDLEGDPFVGDSGREYLFGWVTEEGRCGPKYHEVWALDAPGERAAFEAFVDFIMERWAKDPALHVYHYAPYEPAALKRMMGRHATRENEIDRMLRAGLFVDLHAVVKQALRASVEEYSIKKLEAHYGFTREADLRLAGVHLRVVQRALELEEPGAIDEATRRVVAAYNRDDCLSTLALRQWLERLRAELVAGGASLSRPSLDEGRPSDSVADHDQEVREVMEMLLEDLPARLEDRSGEQQARWLLAYMLDWHRREEKSTWWEYFRLRELSDEALLEEKSAISNMQFAGRVGAERSSVVDRYRFPAQETSVRRGDTLKVPLPRDIRFGEVVAIDVAARTLDVKKSGSSVPLHPTSVFSHKAFPAASQASSLMRLGKWVAQSGIGPPGAHRAARDLLQGLPPRIAGHTSGTPLRRDGETGVDAARRLVMALEGGTLAIQGPPGTGKTFTGARMICDLARAGKKIGVCAVSHKVIGNLLEKVVEAAREESVTLRCYHKTERENENHGEEIVVLSDNAKARDALRPRGAIVLGGTAFLWSREEFLDSVDVLFVDEAGQMSLANVLAIAQSAPALVLLGDPRQLEQPIQGSHPEGTGISALDHVLRGAMTIPEDRGLFLEQTWRLHPAICRLTSELFYEGRLHPRAGLERQEILGPVPIAGSGLWFLPVAHDGNQTSSREEVDAVAALVERLTAGDARWRDARGAELPLSIEEILVIAPFNAQVADLLARLPGARIGTVDRFQGQEAPVVIYSMTASSSEDAPRGMEFLYSLNRFNVATSRARCACVVVGSPRLFEPECRTPAQMRLANACCRYLELARELP